MAGWAFLAGTVFGIVLAFVAVHMLAAWYGNRRRARIRHWWESLDEDARKEHVQRIEQAIPLAALSQDDRERVMRARVAIHREMSDE